MKILITGHQGLVGSKLFEQLRREGHMLAGMDIVGAQASAGDISRWDNIKRLGEFDVIINTASMVMHEDCMNDPYKAFQNNVVGTLNLLEFIRQRYPKIHLIHFSSSKIYPVDGIYGPYGITKHVADDLVQEYMNCWGLNITMLRPGCIFGLNNRDHGFLNKIASYVADSRMYNLNGTGDQLRDNIHVQDVARLVSLIIKKPMRKIYDIGGGAKNAISINDAIKRIEEGLHKEARISRGHQRKSDAENVVCEMEEFKKDYPDFNIMCDLDYIFNEINEYYTNPSRLSREP